MQDEVKVTLKPCPFCGFDSQCLTNVKAGAGMFDALQCQHCGATGPYNANYSVPGDRPTRWNTRSAVAEEGLREDFAEAFDILLDVQSALVLTADYSDDATVASFVSSSTEYDRLNKFLHSRQDAHPRAALRGGERHG